MLRRVPLNLRRSLRDLHSHAIYHKRSGFTVEKALATVVVAGSILWYSTNERIHNDAPPFSEKQQKLSSPSLAKLAEHGALTTVVWGSNRSGVVSPESPSHEIYGPTVLRWLDNVALHDLAFHENYAACVDARGDVYHWGGNTSSQQKQSPKLILEGKNIRELQLTESKIYALSASGKVYVLSSAPSEQRPGPTSTTTSWWFSGDDKSIEFAEVVPIEKLGWGERIASIVAGDDHLLAVTSKGRTFVHPVNMQANSYGQLGMRKVEVQNDSASFAVDLVPKSVVDPFVKASLVNRGPHPSGTSEEVSKFDDKSIHFCPYLFEIPVLKGVLVEQVAAGSKSSFARTNTGRVLAWGANRHGQLGLGNVTPLESVTVPTEVILWKFTSPTTKTKCLNVSAGGDLTSFTVTRSEESKPTQVVDVLMCGNGQWGGLGNNCYSTAQGTPVKAKNVSGLLEYNEATRCLEPIRLASITISPSGHVIATLDTSTGGRDLVVWGRNLDGELGNGKRSSVAQPTIVEGLEGERVKLERKRAEVPGREGQSVETGGGSRTAGRDRPRDQRNILADLVSHFSLYSDHAVPHRLFSPRFLLRLTFFAIIIIIPGIIITLRLRGRGCLVPVQQFSICCRALR
ncbi:regulator of chromosome condensation 1/beta-lactamase-inhibitor protein II [Amanita rubescens]|nr:regulator of chromosome condensation 1/beta-lactamase-inhibitor protein II [Amanita rubescens]